MGERIDDLRYLIRYLRDTDPKYSFEVFVFHIFMAIACLVFIFLAEFWLWAISITILYASLTVQYLRIRRVMRQRIRNEAAWRVHT
jgi:hypothetical protein